MFLKTILFIGLTLLTVTAGALGNPYFEDNMRLRYDLFSAPLEKNIDDSSSQFSVLRSLSSYLCDGDIDKFLIRGAATGYHITGFTVHEVNPQSRYLSIRMHKGWSEEIVYAFHDGVTCQRPASTH